MAHPCSASNARIFRISRLSVPSTRSGGLLITPLGYRGQDTTAPPENQEQHRKRPPVRGAITPKVLREVAREAATRAGIENLAPHDLWRTFARLCFSGGELGSDSDLALPCFHVDRNQRRSIEDTKADRAITHSLDQMLPHPLGQDQPSVRAAASAPENRSAEFIPQAVSRFRILLVAETL